MRHLTRALDWLGLSFWEGWALLVLRSLVYTTFAWWIIPGLGAFIAGFCFALYLNRRDMGECGL